MKKEYLSPDFSVQKVFFIEDALNPSQQVTEDTIASQGQDVTEFDPFN